MDILLYTVNDNGADDMKKGFTLIELLAVIIILAIIAVIAVPIIGNVIEDSKLGAIENSVKFYVGEVESSFSEWVIEGIPSGLPQDKSEPGYITFNVTDLDSVLELNKTKPIRGSVKIDNNYNKESYYGCVVNAELVYDNGYIATYTYQNNRANVSIEKTK